ncbi:MAG TPA: DNA internalization-related competence protein ComEC/Rec2 [Rhodothermales bacterium]|nr:DNA internalization-related competence protein ComEC/Rec2 [Rhodothermales bacterium]
MLPDSSIQWRAYPALLLAGCLAVGIVLAHALPFVSIFYSLALMGVGIVLRVLSYRMEQRRLITPAPFMRVLAAVFFMLALGGVHSMVEKALPQGHIAQLIYSEPLSDEGRLVTGHLLDTPVARRSGLRFTLAATMLDSMKVNGRVQVTLARSRWQPDATFPDVQAGDVVQIHSRVRPVPRRRNPTDFDYGQHLQRRGIYVTMFVYEPVDVVVLGHESTWQSRLIAPLQAGIQHLLHRFVRTEEARAVQHALILGDRSRLEEATLDRFARTGLMHLLAVSGLHVLMVGMVLYQFLGPFFTRLGFSWRRMQLLRSVATVLVLVVYLFISGGSPSVVRAVVMAALFIGAGVFQRPAHPLNTLGVAAIVLLLIRPSHLFEAGFQLSFAAVTAIVTLHPRFMDALPERWTSRPWLRSLASMTVVSLAATLGTMPVLLYHFGRVALAGLVLNLIAIPLTFLVLAAGIFTLLFGGWLPFLGEIMGAAADGLARLLIGLAEVGDVWLGWAAVASYVQNGWYLLAMVAALIMLVQWPRPRLRWRWGAAVLLFAGAGVWVGVLNGSYKPTLDILFFDVGHGDAALISLPNGRHVLIDTGERDPYADQGLRTILPHLERYGIARLDAVVISHPHNDHLGGLPALLRSIPVRRVLHNGQTYPSVLYKETMHLLDSLDISNQPLHAGDTLQLDPSVLMQVLAPESGAINGEANEASVVIRLVYGDTSFLFTGDAEADAEAGMVARYDTLLHSDVVKVGHHGSRTSSTAPFVMHAMPDTSGTNLAVVSVGSHTRFGLPDEEVIARWRAHGATVWITNGQGALWLRSDGKQISRVDWR